MVLGGYFWTGGISAPLHVEPQVGRSGDVVSLSVTHHRSGNVQHSVEPSRTPCQNARGYSRPVCPVETERKTSLLTLRVTGCEGTASLTAAEVTESRPLAFQVMELDLSNGMSPPCRGGQGLDKSLGSAVGFPLPGSRVRLTRLSGLIATVEIALHSR